MTDQPRITTASSAEGAATAGHIDKLAIVVVTFKRQELLAKLFDSFCALTRAPWRIIIVDNEHSDRTREMVEDLGRRTDDLGASRAMRPTRRAAPRAWSMRRKRTTWAAPAASPLA